MTNYLKSKTARKFEKFYRLNPKIWIAVCETTVDLIKIDCLKKCSMWLIFNGIRWKQFIETRGDEKFKLSNDFIAYYSRLMMACYPKAVGSFFNTKKMKQDWVPDSEIMKDAQTIWKAEWFPDLEAIGDSRTECKAEKIARSPEMMKAAVIAATRNGST